MNKPNHHALARSPWRPLVDGVVASAVAFGAAACASTQTAPSDQITSGVVIPQPMGEHYLIHYADQAGIRRRDTRDRTDVSLLPSNAANVVARESGDKRKLAVLLRLRDSTVLAIIDVASGDVSRAHALPGAAEYTFGWSRNSQELAFGYYTTSEPGGGRGMSGIAIVGPEGDPRDVGCSVSNRLVAWVANGNLAVGDGRNYYIVSPRNCGTLATIPLSDKSGVTFSPDGRRMFLYKRPVDQFSRQRAGNRLELYVADYNGANARRATDYRYEARNARWSPDGYKIAFELKSQRFTNLTHLAVYDVARDEATFDSKARTLGQPDDGNPHWAPSGAKLVHDRAFARQGAGQSYSTNQKVVKALPGAGATLSSGEETVVSEELQTGGAVAGEPVGSTWGWVDDQRIVFTSPRWTRIVNIDAKTTYDLPAGVTLLSVAVVGAGE